MNSENDVDIFNQFIDDMAYISRKAYFYRERKEIDFNIALNEYNNRTDENEKEVEQKYEKVKKEYNKIGQITHELFKTLEELQFLQRKYNKTEEEEKEE